MANCRKILRFVRGEYRCNRTIVNSLRTSTVPVSYLGDSRVIRAEDFFPEKDWRVLAAGGYIGDDPYTGMPGVTRLKDDTWQVTTQLATRRACLKMTFVFRFLESLEQTRLIFSPLLERFIAGEVKQAVANDVCVHAHRVHPPEVFVFRIDLHTRLGIRARRRQAIDVACHDQPVKVLEVPPTALAGGVAARLDVQVRGEIAAHDVRVLQLAALEGVFGGIVEEAVTYVNAPLLASQLASTQDGGGISAFHRSRSSRTVSRSPSVP